VKFISGKRFANILESRGWTLVLVKDSHHDLHEITNFLQNFLAKSLKRGFKNWLDLAFNFSDFNYSNKQKLIWTGKLIFAPF
jgi:hypothetical protein